MIGTIQWALYSAENYSYDVNLYAGYIPVKDQTPWVTLTNGNGGDYLTWSNVANAAAGQYSPFNRADYGFLQPCNNITIDLTPTAAQANADTVTLTFTLANYTANEMAASQMTNGSIAQVAPKSPMAVSLESRGAYTLEIDPPAGSWPTSATFQYTGGAFNAFSSVWLEVSNAANTTATALYVGFQNQDDTSQTAEYYFLLPPSAYVTRQAIEIPLGGQPIFLSSSGGYANINVGVWASNADLGGRVHIVLNGIYNIYGYTTNG